MDDDGETMTESYDDHCFLSVRIFYAVLVLSHKRLLFVMTILVCVYFLIFLITLTLFNV